MTGISAALAAALPLLGCPACGAMGRDAAVSAIGRAGVGCVAGHRFDVARHGYLSLLGPRSRTDTADTAAMVAARVAFLEAGHYRPIAEAVRAEVAAGPVLDLGAGPGWYLAAALAGRGADAVGLAVDASRYAARRAARHPRVAAVVADAWSRIPVRDAAMGTVLSVFAPRVAAEVTRVLRPGGRLVAVTPAPEHLAEIRDAVGMLTVDAGKPERLTDAFAGLLRPVRRTPLRYPIVLDRAAVAAVAGMGPSAHHLSREEIDAAVGELATLTGVTVAVTISVLER